MAYTTIDDPTEYYEQFEYQGNETARSFKNLKLMLPQLFIREKAEAEAKVVNQRSKRIKT